MGGTVKHNMGTESYAALQSVEETIEVAGRDTNTLNAH